MNLPPETKDPERSFVVQSEDAKPASPEVLPKGRLDRLIRQVAALYRKAHLTAGEARYVHQRARTLARGGIRGRSPQPKRLPEILPPQELQQILAQAYRERPRDGLIVRTLFETGLMVSELVRVQAGDVDFTERTLRVRGGKDRLVVFTEEGAPSATAEVEPELLAQLLESARADPFTPRRIQQIVRAVARKAGVEKTITPHTCRHSMAIARA